MAVQETLIIPARRSLSWSGIFAGTFCYLAIEATFGALGEAIFRPVAEGGSVLGFEIWMVILSIIALYFAGRVSSNLLARGSDTSLARWHGLTTFGMSVFATVLILVGTLPLGGFACLSSGSEYALFVALVLSMISAMIGAASGVSSRPAATLQEQGGSLRNAA